MPFGGNACLALTAESPLEPELPIRDHHHHFWDFRAARIPSCSSRHARCTARTGRRTATTRRGIGRAISACSHISRGSDAHRREGRRRPHVGWKVDRIGR